MELEHSPKRCKLDSDEQHQSQYFTDQKFMQGTGFGLNFVTYQEYQHLKSEHDKLRGEMTAIRKSFLQEIESMKKENAKLKNEIDTLKNVLEKSKQNVSSEDSNSGAKEGLNGHLAAENTGMQSRLEKIEEELEAIKANHPPIPSQENISFMKNLASYYDGLNSSEPTPSSVYSSSALKSTPLPVQITFPDSISTSPFKMLDDGLSNLSTSTSPSNGDAIMLNANALTPSHPTPDDESCYTQKIQLLNGYNIWVNKSKLFAHLREAENPKAIPPEQAPLFILRRVMLLVFSLEELAYSRGQGIMIKNNDPTTEFRQPLDPIKVQACKEYMRKWCLDHGRIEPTEKVINTVITHQITYARTKMKRASNKLKTAISSGNLPLLNTSLESIFSKGDMSEEDSNAANESGSVFKIKEEN